MEELRSSLEGMVSQAVIQENMNYYEDYINEQIRNGKNEQDVLNELGSPRLIARSDTILPGSWVANGFRHRANTRDRPWLRPVTTAVLVSSMPPA